MSLSRKRNKARMRQVRATQVQPKPEKIVQPDEPLLDAVSPSVQRDGYGKISTTVQPSRVAQGPVTPKQEKIAELRQIIDAPQSTTSPLREESNSRLPWYNPLSPQTGKRVRMPSGDIMIVPELDADGNAIETSSTGRLVSDNEFKPSFIPNPKPEKKQKTRRW